MEERTWSRENPECMKEIKRERKTKVVKTTLASWKKVGKAFLKALYWAIIICIACKCAGMGIGRGIAEGLETGRHISIFNIYEEPEVEAPGMEINEL